MIDAVPLRRAPITPNAPGTRRPPFRTLRSVALLLVLIVAVSFAEPAPASASILSKACSVAGDFNGVAGKACGVLSGAGKVLGGGSASAATTALGLAAIVAWVVVGAKFSLSETTKILGEQTSPQLRTTWFSSTYWRIAGIAMLLTLPFLFAAAAQALVRSDLALLARAALGYLPLAMLAVAIAAPLTMLLLAATDQLCAVVSSAGGAGGPGFSLGRVLLGGGLLTAAPFLVFLVGLLTSIGAVILWLELAVREAAVYVIVLMLPLAFAAMVWPARRVWAVRSVELLVALILSKLAIVAVLDLGGAALDQLGHHGLSGLAAGLGGTVLVLLAAFSPWAVLRLVPLSELASGAVGSLRPGAYGTFREADELRQAGEARLGNLIGGGASDMSQEGDDGRSVSEGSRGPEAETRRLDEQEGNPRPDPNGRGPDRASGSAEADAVSAPQPQDGDGALTPEQRSPLHPVFQADDLSLEPLTLGPDVDYGRAFSQGGRVGDGSRRPEERGDQDHEPSGDEGPSRAARPAEDHEPLPPPQEPDQGLL